MDSRRGILSLALAFILGFLIGLVLFGWNLTPVQYTNLWPNDLDTPYKNTYLLNQAELFALNGDGAAVKAAFPEGWENPDYDICRLANSVTSENANAAGRLASMAAVFNSVGCTQEIVEQALAAETPESNGFLRLLPLLIALLALLGVLGAMMWMANRRRNDYLDDTGSNYDPIPSYQAKAPERETIEQYKRPEGDNVVAKAAAPIAAVGGAVAASGAAIKDRVEDAVSYDPPAPKPEPIASGLTTPAPSALSAPVANFRTTYVRGDDGYDDSYSIDSTTGEFLGECGVGISETIGMDTPSNVTAMEVWLFDKNDIRTVTKVVMSEHAFFDDAMKAKLAPKGEPVLARLGDVVVLETAALTVRAKVVEAEYSSRSEYPAQSVFDRFTIELSAWAKDGLTPPDPNDQTRAGDMLNF